MADENAVVHGLYLVLALEYLTLVLEADGLINITAWNHWNV